MQPLTLPHESESLRRRVQDLAALSSLTAISGQADLREVAQSLADALSNALPVAFVYVRIGDQSGQPAVEMARASGVSVPDEGVREIARKLNVLLSSGNPDSFPAITNPVGTGTVRLAVFRFGPDGLGGVFAAGSPKSDFPGELDRLLLSVAANLAAAVIGRHADAAARRQVEDALRRSEARTSAMFDAALDCIISIDHDGRVVEFNAAAERTFGHRRDDAIGRQMVELIIPPSHREAHKRGLARYIATGEGPILNRRLELSAMRADGTEFPVELTVIPIPVEGPPQFTAYLRDITDRKRAEETLRERERRYELVVAGAEAAIWDWDVPRHRVAFSPRWKRLRGFSDDEVGDREEEWSSGIHPDDVERVMAAVQAHFDGQTPVFAEEYRVRHREGHWVWILDRGIALRDAEGRVIRMAGSETDITERKRAEEALRQSEERYRSLTEAITSVVWTTDALGRFVRHQPTWSDYTGQTWGEHRDFGWLNALHPDDREAVWRLWDAACTSRTPYESHGRLWHAASGSYRHFEARGVPILNPDGSVREWVGKLLDIEDRRRTEEKLRLLWEAAAVLLSANDPDAMLRELFAKIGPHLGLDSYFNYMVNETGDALRLESCMGVSDQMAGSITPLAFGEDVCGTVAARRQPIVAVHIQQSGDPMLQLVKSSGMRAYVCNPLMSGSQLLGTLSFASRTRDEFAADELAFLETICHYVNVAYERLRLVGQLREADRRKDEFLATLAHELRNPLAPVRNAVHILRLKGFDDPELRWSQDVIDRQVANLSRLIDDLLDINRITRNKLELRRERLALAEIVSTAVEASRPLIDEYSHQLSVTLPSEPVYLYADIVRMAQVFTNLLSNAAKYTDPGGRIWLAAEREESGVVVRVRDTGVGIPADKVTSLFEMFFQVDPVMERSKGGLGVGLSLVRRLVELHGGTVSARSEGVGKGSEFTVRIPALAEEPEGQETRDTAGIPTPLPRITRRILVADDMRDSADSLAVVLRLAGNQVETAYDGVTAVELAERLRPDVVLLDIGMPKLSGYETCRVIRAQPWGRGMYLIALTGWGHTEDQRRTEEAGFDRHLVKPVDPAALLQLLAEEVDGPTMEQ